MSTILSESVFGGCPCNAGKDQCDCGLHNRQIALEVNAEYETIDVREDYDERYAMTELGHRVSEWTCAIGIVLVVGMIVFGVL